MGNGGFGKIGAAAICAQFDLKKEARLVLGDGMGPREFVDALLANRQYVAGIDFLAHALPVREAIWWGCLCLQHACGKGLSAEDRAAGRAAAQWVLLPTEENRVAAHVPARAAGPASPAGALAAAANQTGGTSAPAGSVANAVKLASIPGHAARIADRQRSFVELGIGVADGRFVTPGIRR